MAHKKYDQLDFNTVKQNLKTFLQSQDKFKDYDFAGSSLSVLLDILAYNTAYNGFYLNMLSSEMFLDSASMKNSVTSISKHLGYLPRCVNSLRAKINITITVPEGADVDRLFINRDTPFATSIDGKKYFFVPEKPHYVDLNQDRKFIINDIDLIQGTRITHDYTVNYGLPTKQRFILPNKLVDLSTLVVTVKQSETNSTEQVFVKADDVNRLGPNDAVYFLQPYEDDMYEVVFGDGILGKRLQNGNVITFDYIVSSGPGALGAKVFVSAYSFGQFALGNTNIVCTSPAKDYADPEDIDSIKFQAPRFYTTQNRALTKFDYETLLKRDIPVIEHVRVWGGEENDPPVYGKVFCAIKPISGYSLNTDDKLRLINNYIKPRCILSFDVELVEPDYVNLSIDTTVNYFADRTNLREADLKQIVAQGIDTFRKNNLSGFDSDFRHSRFISAIGTLNPAIDSVTADVKIRYRITPPLYAYFSKQIMLNNEIDRGDAKNDNSTINSSEFIYRGSRVRLADDGLGKLYVYYSLNGKRIVVNSDVGEVDYKTGKILIKNLFVEDIPNQQFYIDLFAMPKNDDVISLKSQILIIDNDDVSITAVNLNRVRLS